MGLRCLILLTIWDVVTSVGVGNPRARLSKSRYPGILLQSDSERGMGGRGSGVTWVWGLASYLLPVLVRTGTYPGRNPADLGDTGLALRDTPPGTHAMSGAL